MMTASPGHEKSVLASRRIRLVDTGFNVLPSREATGVSDNTLACDDVVLPSAGPAGRHPEGSDTIRVTEGNYSEASQHCDACVCAFGLFHKSPDGFEYIFFIDSELSSLLKVVSEYIEQKF